ncbi:uncharacterized protein LOC126795829 [Argentina anserina]|uniref:uncharacterized protein LOC126795829 n=1 Tax=Argentina anserina TaxID=57926 RepID=UPI0021768515|nr:uncharacterized protein LOC126795829 [Potentilla anserina]
MSSTTAVASNTIVHQVLDYLDQQNYQDWSSRMETYLSAEDLWDVVTSESPVPRDGEPDDEYKGWMKKNAKALHAIKVSCGAQVFSTIREARTAKKAWDDLEKKYKSNVDEQQQEQEELLEIIEPEGNSSYDSFFEFVDAGDCDNVNKCLATPPGDTNALKARDLENGYTPLHCAARKGHLSIVEKFLELVTPDDMKIRDMYGYTALQVAVDNGHLEIVKKMLLKMSREDLGITNTKGATVLHTAAKLGNVQIVKELVTKMIIEDLETQNKRGYTALGYALVARNVGEDKCSEADIIKMAKFMVEKNPKILTISLGSKLIPVVEACKEFKWDVVRYLCSVTPREAIQPPENASQGATLLCCCLEQQKFDIASDLLSRWPALADVADLRGEGDDSPILLLSRMRPVFMRDMQLRFWQKWYYDWISRPVDSKNPDGTKIVPANVSNSKNDQRKHADVISSPSSIQPQADSNPDQVSIDVPNLEINPGSKDPVLSSVICLPPPADSDVRQGSYAHLSPVMLFKRLKNRLCQLTGINRIRKIKSVHDQIVECICFIGKESENLNDEMVSKSIFEAIKQGDVDFVTHMCNENRQLIDVYDEEGKTIFHMAIECRQEEVFNLLFGLSEEMINEFGRTTVVGTKNSMLHSAGTRPPLSSFNHIQGASLQIQRELQWFKEVEKVVPPGMYECRNTTDKLTARELFHSNHEKLMDEAEKSMKGTASSCTVVGSLIITMMFAAAFTTPGGNDSNSGIPVFVSDGLFMFYIIADAVSLVTSTTSVLIFLGILTSRYAEKDFLINLPTKMMIGLFALFVSIATMMMTFYSGLVMMLRGQYSWVVTPTIVVASIPVFSFAWMLSPLLVQTFISTYGRGIFRRKVKCQQWLQKEKLL